MSCGTTLKMGANICTGLETSASTESNRQGTNILIVKGTAHTGMKDIRTKATVITLASFGVDQFKKSLKKKDENNSKV